MLKLLIVSQIIFISINAQWNFSAKPSSRLQKIFNLPPTGWIGGDEDTSLQLKDSIYLWLFGDSIIGKYNNQSVQRQDGSWIHSSIGEFNEQNKTQQTINWIWKSSGNGAKANGFFNITSNTGAYDYVWVCVGITNNNNKAFLLSQEVKKGDNTPLGFEVVGTTAIVMEYNINTDPNTWQYTYTHFPNTNQTINWFSAISYISTNSADEVYILGTEESNINIICRANLSDLFEFNFKNIEYWGWNKNEKHTDNNLKWISGWQNVGGLKYLIDDKVGTSETTLQYSQALKCWYTFRIPFTTTSINFYRSESSDVTSNYTMMVIYKIPYPWSNGTEYFCYSAKSHPELIENNANQLIFTYVCNTKQEPELFAAGNARPPVYIPEFIQVDYFKV